MTDASMPPNHLLTDPLTDAELLERIKAVAVLHGDFTLRSGRTSKYYVDKYRFETQPDILAALGHRFAKWVERWNAQDAAAGVTPAITRVAGAELGGIPLVTATALACGLPTVLVRNQKKDYGTAKQLEGVLEPGERIAIVEDIVTSGGQSIEAANTLTEAGAVVAGILVVVDRREGGRENIEQAGYRMESLLTKADLGIAE